MYLSLNIPKNTSLRTRYLTIDVLDFQFEPWPDAEKTLFQHLRWFLTQPHDSFLRSFFLELRCQTTTNYSIRIFSHQSRYVKRKHPQESLPLWGFRFASSNKQLASPIKERANMLVKPRSWISAAPEGETQRPEAAEDDPRWMMFQPDFHGGKHVFFCLPSGGFIHGTHCVSLR